MKVYVVVTCRSDDDGNNSCESFVFTDRKSAEDKIYELHESELNFFKGAAYNPDTIDDDCDESSFYIYDMDCSGLASNAHIEEHEISLSINLIQKELCPVEANSVGTQLRMQMLTDFMEERKLTAAELARQLDCSKSRICNYLRGETPITKSFRNLVREKYNIEII